MTITAPVNLSLSAIRTDGGTQSRAALTFLKALHSEFCRSDAAKDIADLALQREYGES